MKNIIHSLMRGIVTHLGRLSLKPYGNMLLSPGGDFWIFGVRIMIFIMASAEAISWGYMGSLFGRVNPMIGAGVAGLFIFCLIWIIDANLMTLDLSRSFYDRALKKKISESTLKSKLNLIIAVLSRILIVAGSLIITAPFLAQVMFSKDVESEMARQNAKVISEKRAEIEKPILDRLNVLYREKSELENERIHEAAGVGLSGIYGRGPALRTIEMQLSDKSNEIDRIETQRANAIKEFDGKRPEQLQNDYGIKLIDKGVYSVGVVLKGLLENPAFNRAELAVRAFLLFLFLGLLILKFFQPRSISLYFNEQMQSLYEQYLRGAFDDHLDKSEQSKGNKPMNPLRFEDWCLNTYVALKYLDEIRHFRAQEENISDKLMRSWRQICDNIKEGLEPLIKRRADLQSELSTVERELNEGNRIAEANRQIIKHLEESIEKISRQIEGDQVGNHVDQVLALADTRKKKLKNLSAEILKQQGENEICEKKRDVLSKQIDSLSLKIAKMEMELDNVQNFVSKERQLLANRINGIRVQYQRDMIQKNKEEGWTADQNI